MFAPKVAHLHTQGKAGQMTIGKIWKANLPKKSIVWYWPPAV